MNQETNVQEARVRQPWTAQRVGDILLNNALLIIMAIAVVYIAIKNPNFIKPASLINILSQTAAYLPAALGIGGCIVLTGTDLSAGRAVGITACISASLLQNAANMANKMWPQIGTLPIPVVIVLAMLIGAAIGCFNGFFVAKFKLHPFIVTLGTQLILYTVLLLYVQQGNNKGMAISNLDPSYTGFVKGSLFSIGGTPIPNYVLFAIVLTAVMWFVWNKTTFGKNMFALGSNEEAARVSGVNVFGVTVGVGAPCKELSGMARSAAEARTALEYRSMVGRGQVIYIGDLEPDGGQVLTFEEADERTLTAAVRLGSEQEVRDAAAALAGKIREANPSAGQYNLFLMELVTHLMKMTRRSGVGVEEVFGTGFSLPIQDSALPSLEELEGWCAERYLRLRTLIRRRQTDSAGQTVEAAKEYIRQHYAESDLSVEKLCAYLHLSSTYFSTLFKRETGTSFTAYVTTVRMEAAAEAIRGTEEKTYLIAQRCGYEDPNYFSYVFKRHFGVTPTKYRSEGK